MTITSLDLSDSIRIRISPDLKDRIQQEANRQGLDTSAFMRMVLSNFISEKVSIRPQLPILTPEQAQQVQQDLRDRGITNSGDASAAADPTPIEPIINPIAQTVQDQRERNQI